MATAKYPVSKHLAEVVDRWKVFGEIKMSDAGRVDHFDTVLDK